MPAIRPPCIFSPSLLTRFVLLLLPAHVKRATILVSLAAKVEKIKPEDEQILKSINKTLDLVEFEGSLKMPVVVKDLIWVDTNPVQGELTALKNNAMSAATLHEYARSLVSKIPKSLRYGTDNDMEQDFFQLFRHTTPTTA